MPIVSPRASIKEGVLVPLSWPKEKIVEWCRKLAEAIRAALDGKLETVSTVSLTANAATTTITDERIGPDTVIVLTPTTANAAAEIGNGTIYQTLPNATAGSLVLNHANNSQADRTFGRLLVG